MTAGQMRSSLSHPSFVHIVCQLFELARVVDVGLAVWAGEAGMDQLLALARFGRVALPRRRERLGVVVFEGGAGDGAAAGAAAAGAARGAAAGATARRAAAGTAAGVATTGAAARGAAGCAARPPVAVPPAPPRPPVAAPPAPATPGPPAAPPRPAPPACPAAPVVPAVPVAPATPVAPAVPVAPPGPDEPPVAWPAAPVTTVPPSVPPPSAGSAPMVPQPTRRPSTPTQTTFVMGALGSKRCALGAAACDRLPSRGWASAPGAIPRISEAPLISVAGFPRRF